MIRTFAEFRELIASFARPTPARDWFLVLVFSFALFGGIAVYAGYLFFGINGGGIIGTLEGDTAMPPTITRNELEDVLEIFRARAVNFDANNFPREDLFDPR